VIPTGSTYRFDFPVIDRAGTSWYYAHPHHRTGMQAHRNKAGILQIRDDAEERLGLTSGAREIPPLIRDRRVDAEGRFAYVPAMHERMEVTLVSQAFEAPYRTGGMGSGGMGGMGGRGLPQGAEVRLVECAVTRAVTPAP